LEDISDISDRLGEDIDRNLKKAYEATNPNWFRRLLDYVTGKTPGKSQYLFLILLSSFFIGTLLAFDGGSITGNITLSTVTKGDYSQYLIFFVLLGITLLYLKEN
jgi:hypothetical protein